jgi:ABC-type branched-subunit amino acid transport system permease subunit
VAAEAIGIDIARERLIAPAISAGISGLGGVLILKTVSEVFRSLEDGVTLWGTEFAARAGVQEVALALIMLAILIFRPEGLFGGTEIGALITNRLRSSRDAAPASKIIC